MTEIVKVLVKIFLMDIVYEKVCSFFLSFPFQQKFSFFSPTDCSTTPCATLKIHSNASASYFYRKLFLLELSPYKSLERLSAVPEAEYLESDCRELPA